MHRIVSAAVAVGLLTAPASAMAGQSAVAAARPAASIAAPAPTGPARLTVATYNICRKLICPARGGAWSTRKAAILRSIKVAAPDLLLLQELDDVDGSNLEMERALAPLGYTFANKAERCQPIMCSNQIFYKSTVFGPAGEPAQGFAGNVRETELVGADRANYIGEIKDRPFGYAFLKVLATGTPVAVVSVHMTDRFDGGKLFAPARRARLDQARGLPGWIDAEAASLGLQNVRSIIGGDMNSHVAKEPDGPQKILTTMGYVNGETARVVKNGRYGTINLTAESKKFEGFPPTIRRYYKEGPRIDAILAKGFGAPLSWEIFLKLKGAKFDNGYRGSDHNMVRVVYPLV